MDELTREFLIESQEGLDRMERGLTGLEQRPEDNALLAEIFRSVHTIKGTTGFLGFKRLERLAHAGESLLGLLRDSKLVASGPIITGLLQLLDGLRGILKTIEAEDNEGEGADTELIARLEALQAPVARKTAIGESTAASSRAPQRKAARARAGATSSAGRPAVPVPHVCKPVVADGPGHSLAAAAPPMATEAAPKQWVEHDVECRPSRAPVSSAAESTLRVDIALLNRMMNLVGELVLTRNQLLQATTAQPALTQLSRRLDMVTADLRESVMKARMQPVSNVFSKMPRMVRDLSQSLHRRVRLEMVGQETELDKSLLEAIKDPLTYAVRNALDHGIETPEVREAAGKNPEGTLRLRAMQEGSHVIVEVADDGAGISVERIRDKAIELGLITAKHAAQQSERALLQLLFLPGFSTASKITNVSGRGVGMDVVRTNVEKIGGKVEIDSRAGKGTTLRLRIPLTLAIIPALIVRSAGQSFALPQAALSELVHVPLEKAATTIEWIENAPLYRLRGKLLPLVFLDWMLAPGQDRRRSNDRDRFIAVLDAEGRRFGLVVDGLADPEEIVVKPLNAALRGIGLYSGATMLGSGHLALILDPGGIAQGAGITVAGEAETAVEGDNRIDHSNTVEYLLVDLDGHRAAVPLDDVLRIEQLPVSRIEYIGKRPVLNFEGRILPIEDAGGVLLVAQGNPSAQIAVVLCREGDRQVGIVVSHVLDIAPGAELFEVGNRLRTRGVTLLKERVTDVVDLGAVAPLAASQIASQTAAKEHSEFAETVQ
jgi:two-component system, chemotaxis family, sensor kinase CheA